MSKNLYCPYDLSDPLNLIKWDLLLKKHWFIEAFKISYPNIYMVYKYIELKYNIYKLRILNFLGY